MSKAMLIVNPSSGEAKNTQYVPNFVTRLLTEYEEVTTLYTEKEGDATRFSSQAADEGYAAVFAFGGDGTVSECINGLADKGIRPEFGLLPGGTVNNLARQLQIPLEIDKAIDTFSFNTTQTLDIGVVNRKYFVTSVSVGAIPEAVQDVSVEDKTKSGAWAYIKSGIQAVKQNDEMSFLLHVDGEQEIELKSSLILVALGSSIAGIRDVLPEATLQDGYLHVIALKGNKILDKWTTLPSFLMGKLEENEHIFYRAVHKIDMAQIKGKPLTSNVDGDEGDPLPVSVSILPHHLTFFVPANMDAI